MQVVAQSEPSGELFNAAIREALQLLAGDLRSPAGAVKPGGSRHRRNSSPQSGCNPSTGLSDARKISATLQWPCVGERQFPVFPTSRPPLPVAAIIIGQCEM